MYKGEGRKKEKGVGVRFIELAIKVRAVKQELNQIKSWNVCFFP